MIRTTHETNHGHYAHDAALWAHDVLNFHADPKQREVLASAPKRGILNCTRQWGKSTTCAIKAVHHAHFNPESLVIVASPSLRQSAEFLRKAKQAIRALGIPVRGDGENTCSLLLPNNSRIVGLPESEDTIRGFSSVSLMMIDEAARVSDDMYQALRPMLAVGNGAIWLLSTPNGRTGFFYREWMSDRPWLRVQAAAEECPRIPKAFPDEEREALGDDIFRQEYGCEFVSGEGMLFDEVALRRLLTDKVPPLW